MPAKKPAANKAAPATNGAPSGGPLFKWTNEKRRLGDLIPWEKNPRQMTQAQADQLRASIKKFGYIEPIQITPSGRIVGGHMRKNVIVQRLLAPLDTEVDVRVCDHEPTEEEYEEMSIRLNKNTAQWDEEALANNFDSADLIEWGFEPAEFGMEDAASPSQGKEADPTVCPKCKRPYD